MSGRPDVLTVLREWKGADPWRQWLISTAGVGQYECSLSWKIDRYKSGRSVEFAFTPEEAMRLALADFAEKEKT